MRHEEKQQGRIAEILRFAVTGGVCFLVEFGVLVLLVDTLHTDTLIATPVAFLVSVVFNYLLCMKWVFRDTRDGGTVAKVGFLLTSVLGLLLNELLMFLFRLLLGEDTVLFTVFGHEASMYMLNKVLASLLVMVWNYLTKKAVLTSPLARKITEKLFSRPGKN